MEPSELRNDTHLVACIDDLPFHEGSPISPVVGQREVGVVLVDYSSSHDDYSPEHHVMTILGDLDDKARHPNDRAEDISGDKITVDAPLDKDEPQ